MSDERTILVAEDDESDVFLLQRAFKEAGLANAVQFVHDGQEAVDFLTRVRTVVNDRFPALVILDLKMPRLGGMDALGWIRRQEVLRSLPVMIFSSSARREDVETAYSLGVNAYIVKPPSTVQRVEMAHFIKDWIRFNEAPLASTEGFQAAQAACVARELSQPKDS